MRKILFLVLTGILSLSLESCSSISTSKDKSADNNSVKTISVAGNKEIKKTKPNQNAEKKEPSTAQAEEFKSTKTEEKVAGLIPATKPEVRVRGSIRGRQDPFATVTIQPQIEIIEQEETERETLSPTSSIQTPEDLSTTPIIEDEIAVAKSAKNVFISGLIEFGDRIKLIVQEPQESSARYVEIGQYLSNGRVLVKRIEPGFPSPTVILEQDGVEVPKVIGQSQEEDKERITFAPFEQESITSASLEK